MITSTNTTNGLGLIVKFVSKVFPYVNQELDYWRQHATSHGCRELSEQALASIRDKKFHCQGGSIYSLYNGVATKDFVRLVVALQTISDYLDNLCDRVGVADEQAFRQLHLAMTDALDPEVPPRDYYKYYPFNDDGNYLNNLVSTCQRELAKLPSYSIVKPEVLKFANLYSELQTYKHLDLSLREDKMLTWTSAHLPHYPGITPWEFAAATGSTLGMFMLCAVASKPGLTTEETAKISAAYFPWICGLHILLDYFIDSAEDRTSGDLNFVSYYIDKTETLDRLSHFYHQALTRAGEIPDKVFTETVIHGLLAMYLSDSKAGAPDEKPIKKALLDYAGTYTKFVYTLCRLLRTQKVL